MKYKILGIILIVGLIGLIVAIILVATSDGGTRQQAEDFLESAVKAQNTARLFDVRQVQSGLSNYFRINSAYPRTLTEAGTMIPQLHQTDISNPEHISYEQTKNGQGYLISFSFSDGRKFEVDETQSALDYQEEAERIPEEFFASSEYQESISQLTEQQRQLTQRGAQEEFIPITRIDKAGAVILSPQFEGLPNSGNVTGRSFSKNGEKLV